MPKTNMTREPGPMVRVDVSYPLRGGLMVTSFCTERAALAFVREENLAVYKITIGNSVFRRQGM